MMVEDAGSGKEEEEEAPQLSYKLVPWFSWDEWTFVRKSIFSSSPASVSAALDRINTWRGRGCLPCPVEVTASLVEAQQKDPFFRPELSADCVNSDEMLAMAYCMAIMRLVNGFVEKTRKKNGPSIYQSAERIGIPRMLVDIRHECSHRQLPSAALSRMASTVALDWVKSFYWGQQKKAIPNVKKEVKLKLREMASYLHAKHLRNENDLQTKKKRSKRHISTITKSLNRLFTAYPSEVVAVLVDRFQKFLLKSGITEVEEEFCSSFPDTDSAGEHIGKFDSWKAIVVELSKNVPALLLCVIESLIKLIEAEQTQKYEHGHQDNNLSLLIEQLVKMMIKGVNCSEVTACERRGLSYALDKTRLLQLLFKCLLVSPGNKHLISCAIVLSRVIGKDPVVEKLEKLLPVLELPGLPPSALQIANCSEIDSIFQRHKESLRQSAMQLESLKQYQSKNISSSKNFTEETQSKTWKMSRSWSPSPIGMLPYSLGPEGTLPIIVKDGNLKKVMASFQVGLDLGRTQILGKREGSCDEEELESLCSLKKARNEGDTLLVDVENSNTPSLEGLLMMGGCWKKIEQEQLLELESSVEILV